MQLIDINRKNQKYFFTCLWPEKEGWNNIINERKKWYNDFRKKGYQAKLLMNEEGQIAGKCHYVPIEYSPLIGKDLLVILCLYVHVYDHYIGDQRGKGYGRFMLYEVEKMARSEGYGGVATWAMDWHWNPMTFYVHMGYREADRIDKAVVLWKPFRDMIAPRFNRIHPHKKIKRKVQIVVSDNAWCNGNNKIRVVREAIRDLKDKVDYYETLCPCHGGMLHLGHVGGIFLDGEPYKPYELVGEPDELRNTIIALYEEKNQPVFQ
jgi:GNAT superfamily N-acetyltransferase